jgi:rubrerythrin
MVDSHIVKIVVDMKKKEDEAAKFYTDAEMRTTSPMGKRLFDQLALFEKHHYFRLSELEKNLREQENFIKYERHEIPSSPRIEFSGGVGSELPGILKIIQQALKKEQEAEKLYLKLADETVDPDGHYMFDRLSEEEHLHFHILKDAYWSLNNTGVWEWTIR